MVKVKGFRQYKRLSYYGEIEVVEAMEIVATSKEMTEEEKRDWRSETCILLVEKLRGNLLPLEITSILTESNKERDIYTINTIERRDHTSIERPIWIKSGEYLIVANERYKGLRSINKKSFEDDQCLIPQTQEYKPTSEQVKRWFREASEEEISMKIHSNDLNKHLFWRAYEKRPALNGMPIKYLTVVEKVVKETSPDGRWSRIAYERNLKTKNKYIRSFSVEEEGVRVEKTHHYGTHESGFEPENYSFFVSWEELATLDVIQEEII